jgi:hypothetical protein
MRETSRMALNGLLADVHCVPHLTRLLRLFESADRRELWGALSLARFDFADIGLPLDATDRAVWEKCQSDQLLLITANRNDDGPDSLEAALRGSTAESLPVITVGDLAKLMTDSSYAESAADRLLEYLYDIDQLRGTGRLFLP